MKSSPVLMLNFSVVVPLNRLGDCQRDIWVELELEVVVESGVAYDNGIYFGTRNEWIVGNVLVGIGFWLH